MSAALNNTIKYSSTAHATTQALYGFRTRETFDLLRAYDLKILTTQLPLLQKHRLLDHYLLQHLLPDVLSIASVS